MKYHFRIISSEAEDFVFEILMNSDDFFIDLHNFIQEKLNLDKSQITSFFLTDSEWNKELEITLLDMMDEEGEQKVMDKVRLNEVIYNKKQRLLYLFDMLADRVLFIELININNKRVKTPACLRLEGEPPQPLCENFDVGLDEISDKETFDEDFDDFLDNNDYDDQNECDSQHDDDFY